MKHYIYTIVVGILSLTSWVGHVEASFTDAATSQYVHSIEALEERGLVQGYSDGTFRPFQAMNRAEFLRLTMDASGITPIESGNCFSDVHEEWFARYVCGAVERGVIKGYPDGSFRAGQVINMVEAQKIVASVFDLAVGDPSEGEEWFQPYVNFYHDNSFFSKYSYHPGKDFRREEMAYMIEELLLYQEGRRNFTFVRNSMSKGCGRVKPSQTPTEFSVDGQIKKAIVAVPGNYSSSKPVALLFAFHGRTSSNERVRSYFRLEQATAGAAIVVYPAGNQTGSTYNWNGGERFFDVMLWEIADQYCVDLDRVFAVGHSMGAVFTNDLACTRATLLRGVASLGGSTSKIGCSGPVAAMVLHNPKDNLVPFSGGEGARNRYIAQNNASRDTVPISEPSWGNCVQYQWGHATSPIVWCPHSVDYERDGTYYPHVWPRETGAVMWKFFQNLPV